MDRKVIARETLDIISRGYYVLADGKKVTVDIGQSLLITPSDGEKILEKFGSRLGEGGNQAPPQAALENISTVDAVRRLAARGRENIGVLNFASAKNPGGGFLNGAMAQEESLAASSTLYRTQTIQEEYYRVNRACKSMMYTDYGIYSPDVVFFRDGDFRLAPPVKASVLTLPAVNMGQVIQKGEDVTEAEKVMRRRMKLALAVFADQGAKNLVLGAYGCGVFRNDPKLIAAWWKELLEEGWGYWFDSVFYAVLDRSKGQTCMRNFRNVMD